MKNELDHFVGQEFLRDNNLKVAIVCLYGYPQKHDSEPFAGQTLKEHLNKRFPDSVTSEVHLLGHEKKISNEVETLAYKLVKTDNTQIIGISIPQGTHQLAEEFIFTLDNLGYKGLMILGHALPTYLPENFINLSANILIVRGWGEESFCKIVEKELNHSRDFSNIPNLTYQQNGEIINSKIEWPKVFAPLTRRNPQKFFTRIEASRGCHHDKCTYCTRPLREKDQVPWVRIPPEIVLQDIENLHKQGGDRFTFTDEDFFGVDLRGAMQIAEGIKRIGNFTFALDLRADSIINPSDSPEKAHDRDLLIKTLIDAGLSFVYIGAETLSETQLKRFGKGISPSDGIISIKKMVGLSIPMELGLITFDPILSIEELSENVQGLENSGLWYYSGQLFNELHVFEGNPYCRILKRHKLDRGFDPDYMTYSYEYLHPEIAQIRNVCVPLKKEVDSVYTSARNIFRTNFTLPDVVERYITNYRKRELTVLKELLRDSSRHTQTYNEARKREYQDVQILRAGLRENSFEKKPEYNELISNISEYIRNFK